jgi:phytoene dehydrogenase-like protein
MASLARLLEELYLAAPADPTSLGVAVKVRRLGRQGMEDLMRLLPMSIAEWLDEWFECDALKGALGAQGVLHMHQGPRSGGTGFRFLHHHVGSPAGVFRPARSNLRRTLRELAGIEVRRADVARITVREGRVTGIVLGNGEEITAPLVISGVDPQRTLLELADPGWLDPELARSVAHIRRRGVAARISISNEGVSPFSNLAIAPSLDFLERAYDDSKYGRISARPYVEARMAGSRIEVHCQYAPYQLAGGEWDAATRAALGKQAVAALASYLPALSGAQATVLAPPDLQELEGWPEGQPYQAELALDQALWMRPLPELARYRTPIEGLWLCGPATHPGGGILGASGRNCAREILRGG